MNRNDYINKGSYTDNIKQQKAEIWDNYHKSRRKLNIIGGILAAIVTVYYCTHKLGIDLQQPLTDTDKLKIGGMYLVFLFIWRLIRQKIQAAFVPQQVYGAEEQKAIEDMTPQQAKALLREWEELETSCKRDTSGRNAAALILIFSAVMLFAFALKGGII